MIEGKTTLAQPTAVIVAIMFGLAGPVLAMAPLGMAPLLMAGALLATGAEYASTRNWPEPPRGAVLSLGALFVWCAVSLLWDIDPKDGLRKMADLMLILGALLALLGLGGRLSQDQRRLCGLWLAGGLAVGLILLVVETGFDFPLYRMAKGNSDPKLVDLVESKRAVDALPLLVWPAALALAALGRQGLGIALALVFALACTAWTASSATLGMAVSLVILTLSVWMPVTVRRLLMASTLFAFALVIPLAIVAYDHGGTHAQGLKRSGQHRMEIWRFAAEKSLERPLFGHGFDSSRAVPNGNEVSAFQAPDKPIIPLHPHNGFLQIWLELGLVGVVLSSVALLFGLRAVGRWPTVTGRYALAGYAAAFVIAGLAFGIWQSWWLATLAFSVASCHAMAPGAPRVDHA